MSSVRDRARRAEEAGPEELGAFVLDTAPSVLRAVLGNRNADENHALKIASRRNVPSEILDDIAADKRWTESLRIRRALARNPKTPRHTALAQLKFLSLFDLIEITNDHNVVAVIKQKVVDVVVERLPKQPIGIKKTVARKAAGVILRVLMENDLPEVIQICLDNPRLTEAEIYKILHREQTAPSVPRLIAEHPKWSARYNVRIALVLNPNTPLASCLSFIKHYTLPDLKELIADSRVHISLKIRLKQELARRKRREAGEA